MSLWCSMRPTIPSVPCGAPGPHAVGRSWSSVLGSDRQVFSDTQNSQDCIFKSATLYLEGHLASGSLSLCVVPPSQAEADQPGWANAALLPGGPSITPLCKMSPRGLAIEKWVPFRSARRVQKQEGILVRLAL